MCLTHRRIIIIISGGKHYGTFRQKNKDTKSSAGGGSHLKISVSNDGAEYTFTLEGRLDTITSPDLEAKINEVVGDADKLILDLAKLEYIFSAGLRVILGAAQAMDGKGDMVVRNLTPSVNEVF